MISTIHRWILSITVDILVCVLLLCSCRVGVFSGPGSDLAAIGQRLSADEPRLLLIHSAEAAGF